MVGGRPPGGGQPAALGLSETLTPVSPGGRQPGLDGGEPPLHPPDVHSSHSRRAFAGWPAASLLIISR
jgi:hypothetical protein